MTPRPTLLVAVALLAGCDGAPAPPPPPKPTAANELFRLRDFPAAARPARFSDVTAETGIDFVLTSGLTPSTQIVEFKGGGLGLIDYDGDGDLDVFVPNGATMDAPEAGPGCRLFENLGGMRFRDATAEAGLDFRRWGVGVSVGDVDGDGHEDLYITCVGRNALLRNTGDGRFEDVTDSAGVGDDRWGTSSAFGDLDADGDLDLYVANYLDFPLDERPPPEDFRGELVPTGPRSLPAQGDVLYENLGDGTFRDVTDAWGCGDVAQSYGLGVVILDFDADGRPDIFVGNDSMPNFLFRAIDMHSFHEIGMAAGVATNANGARQATMGIAVGDISGNGLPDLYSSNFASDTNTLHMNYDGTSFMEMTPRYGLGMMSFPFLGWACGFYDFNLDTSEDLFVVNGHIYPTATRENMDSPYLQTPLLFVRDGLRFTQLTPSDAGDWLAEAHCDRSAAFGDLDGDGDVDIVVGELNGPIRVLRNEAPPSPWLIVQTDAHRLPCRVEALIEGAPRQVRWIHGGGSFASASARAAHYGLPAGTTSVSLNVTWPDGSVERFDDVPVGARAHVRPRK